GSRHEGFIVFLALCLKLFGTTRAAVLIQTAFNALALTLLYGEWRLWAKPRALWMDAVAVVLIVINPFVLFWNCYVRSATLYPSLRALVVLQFARWMRTGRTSSLFAGVVVTMIAWVTRSNAIGLPFAVAVGVSWYAWRALKMKKAVAIGAIAVSVV